MHLIRQSGRLMFSISGEEVAGYEVLIAFYFPVVTCFSEGQRNKQ